MAGNISQEEQIEILKKLEELLNVGVLTEEEFEAKKREIIGVDEKPISTDNYEKKDKLIKNAEQFNLLDKLLTLIKSDFVKKACPVICKIREKCIYYWSGLDKKYRITAICIPLLVLLIVFLSNAICFHEWVDATCFAAKTCTKCWQTSGEPLTHIWIDADCEQAKHCSICGSIQGKPRGHLLKGTSCIENGYCEICGKEGDPAPGHSWVAATCIEPKYCSKCKIVEGEAIGHIWVEADCIKPKTCSVCKETDGIALGHSFGPWKVVVEATCGENGKESAVCSACEIAEEKLIEKTGNHAYEDWIINVNPTCTTDGHKSKTCSVCGDMVTESIVATGHNFAEAIISEATHYTAGTKGQKCTVCSDTEGSTIKYYTYYKTTPRTIFSEYRSNEISADEKYTDLYVEFSANISKIESGTISYGKIIMYIDNGTWFDDEIWCKIKNAEQYEQIKSLSVGSWVTIKGRIDYDSDMSSYRKLTVDIIEIS